MRLILWAACACALGCAIAVDGKDGTSPQGTGATPTTDIFTGLEPCEGDDCVCAGAGCDVTCSGQLDCDVQCSSADACQVDCNGGPTCHVEGTSSGAVDVDCTGAGDCHVECSQTDSCTVACSDKDCKVTCPATGCEITNCDKDCTATCGFLPAFPKNGTVSCE